jgi:hypothetical protein
MRQVDLPHTFSYNACESAEIVDSYEVMTMETLTLTVSEALFEQVSPYQDDLSRCAELN